MGVDLPKPEPSQRTVALMVTDRCNLRCAHCLLDAGTLGSDMPAAEATHLIREMKEAGVDRVSITGGEPFLCFDLLRDCVCEATRLGLTVTVVTNGYWARSPAEARRKLEQLAGLSLIGISTDIWHEPFVPLETVRNSLEAARSLGIETRLRVTYADDDSKGECQARYERIFPGAAVEVQPLVHTGRAGDILSQGAPWRPTRCAIADKPVIRPNGDVCGCCGPSLTMPLGQPLYLGNTHDTPLHAILMQARIDLLYQLIRVRGPYGLWDLIAAEGFDSDSYDQTTPCNFCVSLLSDRRAVAALHAKAQSEELYHTIGVEQLFLTGEPDMLARGSARPVP